MTTDELNRQNVKWNNVTQTTEHAKSNPDGFSMEVIYSRIDQDCDWAAGDWRGLWHKVNSVVSLNSNDNVNFTFNQNSAHIFHL